MLLRSWAVWTSLLALLLILLGPLLAFAGVLPPLKAFGFYASGALVGIVGMLGGILVVVRGRLGPGLLALGLGSVALLAVLLPAAGGFSSPRINDISTDLDDVPAFSHAPTLAENRGRDMAYPESFKPIVREGYPGLGPLRLPLPPQAAFEQAVALARSRPQWQVTHVDPQALTLEAVVETRLFRFRDDLVVRVRPEGSGSRVDMRSKSRDGKGDLGANARRIREFLQALDAQTPRS